MVLSRNLVVGQKIISELVPVAVKQQSFCYLVLFVSDALCVLDTKKIPMAICCKTFTKRELSTQFICVFFSIILLKINMPQNLYVFTVQSSKHSHISRAKAIDF